MKDIKEYALKYLLAGNKFAGWKIVTGRSNRKYSDEAKVAEAVKAAGYEPYDQTLKGITDMTSMLGGKKFKELLGNYVIKPPGKPVLVRADDKRPEYVSCKNDFMEEEDYE